MPSRNQSGKPEHSHQNPHRKTKRSGKKIPKVMKRWTKLLKREKKEGHTKWIKNEKMRASARMAKFGLTPDHVEQIMASKNMASKNEK